MDGSSFDRFSTSLSTAQPQLKPRSAAATVATVIVDAPALTVWGHAKLDIAQNLERPRDALGPNG